MQQKWFRYTLHAVLWVVLFLLPYFIADGEISMHALARSTGNVVHGVSFALLVLFSYVNYFWLVPKLYLSRRYLLYALVVLAWVLIVIWLPAVLQPFPAEPPHHRPRHGGPPPFLFGANYNMVLFVISTFLSISIQQRLLLMKIKQEKLNAELLFLKAQINPHFLFNTLNSIYSLAIQKSDETPAAIIQLSELMRYILRDSKSNFVLLQSELDYIQNYIHLQRRRLGQTVAVTYTAPNRVENLQVAPLLLMSFIENAFKHGVNPDKDSSIVVDIRVEGKELRLYTSNNKVTAVQEDAFGGIGLDNAKERLQHLYPGRHTLHIEDSAGRFLVNLTMTLE